jgi:hypothetical protein
VLRVGLTLAALLIPLQIFVGDLHGLNTLEHQPQKVAAMEGVWETQRGAPLLLFAIPDEASRSNLAAIGIPKLASLILKHDVDAEIRGLNDFRGAHPPVLPVFWSFRIMVGVGVLMLAVSWLGWWLYRRSGWRPERLPRALLWALAGMTFSGWVATVAGWYVTEIGRQPFIVFGLLRTADVASTVPAPMIALTLALYVTVYLALLVAYIGGAQVHGRKAGGVIRRRAAACPGRAAGSAGRRTTFMTFDEALPVVFMALMGLSMLDLRGQRRLRPRRGHADAPRDEAEKDVMIASIGPFWDANETWLVLGVGILLVAFPKAHGLVLTRALPAGDADARRPDPARRGVRLPRQGQRRAQADLGLDCSSPARRSPRCRRAGCSGATSAASARAGTTRCSPPPSPWRCRWPMCCWAPPG